MTLEPISQEATLSEAEKEVLERHRKRQQGDPLEEEADFTDQQEEEDAEEGEEEDAEEVAEEEEEDTEEEDDEEEAGLSDDEVDAIYESVGGEKVYDQALAWAADAFSQEEQDEFNAVLDTNNPAAIKFAVRALVNRYETSADRQGRKIVGKGRSVPGPKPLESREQLRQLQADPRYKRDPAFRNMVMARMRVSGPLI